MNVEHATRIENILSILENGICSSSQTGVKEYPNLSDENLIYVSAVFSPKTLSYWGQNHFFLKQEWFYDNFSKFHHHYNRSDDFFENFIFEHGLQKLDSNRGDKGYNQLVTRDVIPIEAIDSLIIESREDIDTFDFIYNSNKQKHIHLRDNMFYNIKLVYKSKYDSEFHRIL